MTCTPEEIEQKRRIALEKLQAKKIKLSAENVSPSSNSNLKQQLQQYTVPQQENGNWSPKSYNNNKFQAKSASSLTNKKFEFSPYNKQTFKPVQFFGPSMTVITGICSIISSTRFELNIPYHAKVIEINKTIPSSNYDPVSKFWNFNLQHYELLISKLRKLQPEIVIQNIPKFALNLNQNCTKNDSQIDFSKIEPELDETLMPFQKEGVSFAINRYGRCLIADEMGLGKTLQALAVASYYRQDWPLLIITTSSMRASWEESINKFLPSVPLAYVRYMQTGKDYINDANVLIVSYDMMTRSTDKLLERNFPFLIFDESHTLKNFKAKCTKSATELSKRAKRVILLTGTPALSRPSELFSQLYLIDHKFFGGFMEFSKRYCDGKQTNFGWDASGKSNLTELEIILSKKFMIRRTKADVLTSLPAKSREVIKLDVGLSRLSEVDRLNLSTLIDNYVGKKAQEKHSALLSLFSESARIKIPSVSLYIEQILEKNIKFLAFAHHQVMLDAICKVLNKMKRSFIRIDGNTTLDQRKYFIDKFQLDDSCIAAVLSITAANAGITLTAAQYVIFAELHWNPSILQQAESRAHRIGQENNVIVQYLLGEGTVDDYIWPLLQTKQNVLNEIGLCRDSFKDTAVSDQIIANTSHVTIAGTKNISDFFTKETSSPCDLDQSLQEFFEDDNDELLANVDIDF